MGEATLALHSPGTFSSVMIRGYGLIAVPTGIVTVELSQTGRTKVVSTQACPNCGLQGHDPDAWHCKHCGAPLGTGPL